MRNAELLNIVAWESNADFVQLIGRPDCIGTIGKSWGYVMHVVQVPTCSMYWLEIPRITVFSALYRREMPRVRSGRDRIGGRYCEHTGQSLRKEKEAIEI
jgi:hypothetical protein